MSKSAYSAVQLLLWYAKVCLTTHINKVSSVAPKHLSATVFIHLYSDLRFIIHL